MATITIPNDPWKAGFPSQASDTVNPVKEGLIVGETPAVVTLDQTIAASQTITGLYVPMGYDSSGNLVPAEWHATYSGAGVRATCILLRPITTPASPVQGIETLIQGCLNMDMIAWPASFDTEAKKLNAFDGAPSPTAIVVKKARAGSIVAQP